MIFAFTYIFNSFAFRYIDDFRAKKVKQIEIIGISLLPKEMYAIYIGLLRRYKFIDMQLVCQQGLVIRKTKVQYNDD